MKIVVDTGPLVALLDRRDPYHPWARQTFEQLTPPFLICEAVLTETAHFLNDSKALCEAWQAGELVVDLEVTAHRTRLCTLLEKYRPMDIADACVVVMAEIHHPATVLTIDRKDFARYRIHQRGVIQTLMPRLRRRAQL